MNNKELLSHIIRHYDVNSGVYSAINKNISYKLDEYGEYKPVFESDLSEDEYHDLLTVSAMSDESLNETQLAKKQFDDAKYDDYIGYYTDLYAGYVKEGEYRDNGSSGGMTSWVLNELLEKNHVDGVIHMHRVDPDENDGILFKYAISNSVESVNKNTKSMYYPGVLNDVLKEVVRNPDKKYAVVGIPEFITEIQLLRYRDKQFYDQIVYSIGLVCGHQKTTKYVESLAWQFNIKPGDLKEVDFRVKRPGKTALNYRHKFRGIRYSKEVEIKKTHAEIFGEVWAHGLFKSNFSDFTDNTFNENADIVLGDAWLPEYNADGNGNNIVIVRNSKLGEIIKKGIEDDKLKLDILLPKKIRQSQKGLIHHTRNELPYRLKQASRVIGTVPTKRNFPKIDTNVPKIKRQVQDTRVAMRDESKRLYLEATRIDDWSIFRHGIEKMIAKYKELYEQLPQYYLEKKDIDSRKGISKYTSILLINTRPRVRLKNTIKQLEGYIDRERIRRHLYDKGLKKRSDDIIKNTEGATITLAGYHNYGNVLQRYALQQYLYKNGHNFISLEKAPYYVYDPKSDVDRRRHINRFVSRYIAREHLSKNTHYKIYITGSDQVWRNWDKPSTLTPLKNLYEYMLDFTYDYENTKRLSYAASFGTDNIEGAQLTDGIMKDLKKYAKKFDAISMREDSGVDIVSKYWDVESVKVVDPTLLLNREDYSQIADNFEGELGSAPDIFMYILDDSESKLADIDKFTDRLKEHRIEMILLRLEDELPPVEQWLRNIRDSKLVVTDSFHGVVFCLMFNTPFIVTENKRGGISRIEDVLGIFDLMHLYVDNSKFNKLESVEIPDINWDNVNGKINSLASDSGKWLLGNLDKEKTR